MILGIAPSRGAPLPPSSDYLLSMIEPGIAQRMDR
jgi:hypothetical protein